MGLKENKFILKLYYKFKQILHIRIIIDIPKDGSNYKKYHIKDVSYQCDIDREKVSRNYIFNKTGNFLDVGGGDGKLKYLLGKTDGLFFKNDYEINSKLFFEKFNYYGVDLKPSSENIIVGDICEKTYLDDKKNYLNFFDVIYSNNVFEHLNRPWVAIENIYKMLKPDGICIIIAPFSWRYHEVPNDYFRYSHTAIPSMFKDIGRIETIISGYDLNQRRAYNQGDNSCNDIVPTDHFGAWRESWSTISIIKKTL